MYTINTQRAGRFLRIVSGVAAVVLVTHTPPANAQDDNSADETFELSPFVVTSEGDVGYVAANTLAGSRMNTPLRDTAASISVLTSELISDLGALDLEEAIAYGTNVEEEVPDGNGKFEFYTRYKIRGLTATVGRNYFQWKLPTDTYNVGRIEEARGPNSILFGIASAGGMISTQTKQAYTTRDFRRGQVVLGSYDLMRGSVDINQTFSEGKFGVRFNAVVSDVGGYQHYVSKNDNRAHLAFKYNATPKTVIRAEIEKGESEWQSADNQLVKDSVMKWYYAGSPVGTFTEKNNDIGVGFSKNGGNLAVAIVETEDGISFYDGRRVGTTQRVSSIITDPAVSDPVNYIANTGGPSQTQESKFDTYSVFADHQISENTFLQLAYNHQNYKFEAFQAKSSGTLKGDPNEFLNDGVTPNPHAGEMFFDGYWVNRHRSEDSDNLRLTLSTEFDFERWGEYRIAGLAEREERNWSKNNFNEAWVDETTNQGAFHFNPSRSTNRVYRRHYVTVGDASTYYNSFAPPSVSGFISGLVDPSNPDRTLGTRWTQQSTSDFDDPQEQNSFLLSAQAYYFNRKLVVAGGVREDKLFLHEGIRGLVDENGDRYFDNEANPRNHRTASGQTRTIGVVYHAQPWLSLRYNDSGSQELANNGVRLMPRPDENGYFIGNRVGDNPQGVGKDYGFDLNLLDGKVNFRATKFETNREGGQLFRYGGSANNPTVLSNRILDEMLSAGLISDAERANHELDTGGSERDTASSGYEYTLTSNVTKNWRVMANYSVTDSVTSNVAPAIQLWVATEIPYLRSFPQDYVLPSTGLTIGEQIDDWESENKTERSVEGLATIGNRRQKYSIITRYTFTDGMLDGFYTGATGRHQGKRVVGATSDGRVVYGNSYTRADVFIGYKFSKDSRLKLLRSLNVQLNVQNVLNDHDPLISRYRNEDAEILVADKLKPQYPRSWRLTTNFEF